MPFPLNPASLAFRDRALFRLGITREQVSMAPQISPQPLNFVVWTVGEHADRAHTDHDLAGWKDVVRQPRSNPRRG